ncbi:molybdate ABC transporter substrate-binding protein [Sulfurimonas sp.]|uniref:molybdate ABC transporter substrate-binding protein n=1 Tax=Sulfurimonas sp. TaxID=2022749 RepID=UPI002AB29E85|nr:molybdate ABC transporter substrate-binding protein [Sulfurimonas sp.]
MQKLFFIFLISFSLLNASSIKVAVAANVSYAIKDLTKEFNKRFPNIKVKIILGSSGKLTAQISHGAPYQVFISADMKYPDALYKQKIAITKPKVYALGSLALFSHKKMDLSAGIYALKRANISKIALANPKTAPYGIAAKEALTNAKIYKNLKSKFVYGESISQTVSYAVSATDAGIIAMSSLYSKNMKHYKRKENWIEIDSKLYTPIKQGIVLLQENKDARDFYNFLLSKDAKKIFQLYGYKTP